MISFYTNIRVYIMRFFRALFLFLDQISSVIHTPSSNSSFTYRNLLLLLFFNNVICISNFFEVVQIAQLFRARSERRIQSAESLVAKIIPSYCDH